MADYSSNDGRSLRRGRPSLYSNRFHEFSSLESTLRGNQVFSGDQPDDFAIAGLAGKAPRILILGAGLGSAVRGIIAANPSSSITAVDISSGQIAVLRSLFREYFPEASFQTVHGDAQNLGAAICPENQFDTICVDLYAGSDYAPFVTHDHWWQEIRESYLAPGGKMLANSWGLPTHMDPLGKNAVQASMYRAMANAMGEVEVHSFRRNLTYASAEITTDNSPSPGSWSSLKKADQLWLRLLRLRFANPPARRGATLPAVVIPPGDGRGSREHIDLLMNQKWQESISSNKSVLATLREGSANDAFAERMLEALTSTDKPARDLLPNQWSVEEIQNGEIPTVFLRLSQQIGRQISQFDKPWFIDVWLTQLTSMTLKASAAFRQSSTYDELIETIESELIHLERVAECETQI